MFPEGEESMFTYTAMFKCIPEGVFAEVLDFPGAITFGHTLEEAREMLASALVDMAETHLLMGQPIPLPNPACSDPEADLEEPIYLLLSAANRVTVIPQPPVACSP